MAEATNKLEKLTFVGLYDRTSNVAEITAQDPSGLPGVGITTFTIDVETVAHYCAEAWMLLVVRRIKLGMMAFKPDLPWLPDGNQVTTEAGLTITAAVDRLPGLHEEWKDEIEQLLYANENKLIKVVYANGGVSETKPAAEPKPKSENTLTISVDGNKPVTLTDQELRDLPGKLRKLANGRQAVRP